jgi:hypothetical protein
MTGKERALRGTGGGCGNNIMVTSKWVRAG